MFETVTRSYDYQRSEPALFVGAVSGLEALRRVMDGRLPAPPISATLGFTIAEVDEGRVVFEGTPAEWQYNPLGSVHGGWISTVLDSALGCAVHSTLPEGRGYTTIDLQVRFVRAVTTAVPRVRAEAKVVHAGGRVVTAEARLVGPDGKLYATATTSCLVMEVRAPAR